MISIRIPVKKAGMVCLVGKAARFGTTTRIRELMAPMIKGKDAPCKSIDAMVTGKKTAVIMVMDIPTHAMRFFPSSFVQIKNLFKIVSGCFRSADSG